MTSSHKHIVIAEDDQHIACSLQFILSAAGYRISVARNGEEALAGIEKALARGEEVDLLVTDIAMPLMNGEELIAALRARSIDLPAIVMTGFGDKEMIVRLMRLGCKDFIEKPFRPTELRKLISAFFDSAQKESLEKKRGEDLAAIGVRSFSILHDLSGALAGIVKNADSAREAVDRTHPYYRKLESLFASANCASEICKQLLSIGSCSIRACKARSEIVSVFERMAEVLRVIAPDSVTIETRASNPPVWLLADAEALQQAFLIMGISVIEAMGETGTLTMTLTLEDLSRGGGAPAERCLCVTASGAGPGCPAESRDTPPVRETAGNGSALSCIQTIVDEHGGWVTAVSPAGQEIRYVLAIPMTEPGAAHAG